MFLIELWKAEKRRAQLEYENIEELCMKWVNGFGYDTQKPVAIDIDATSYFGITLKLVKRLYNLYHKDLVDHMTGHTVVISAHGSSYMRSYIHYLPDKYSSPNRYKVLQMIQASLDRWVCVHKKEKDKNFDAWWIDICECVTLKGDDWVKVG